MTKQEFLDRLQAGLLELTESDAQERLTFYSEAIDDRVEEGLSEQEAVAQIGDVQEIVASILSEIPQKAPKVAEPLPSQPEKAPESLKKEQKNGLKPWQIVMLIVGAPLWIPLMICEFAVILSLLAVLWSLVVCEWAAFASLAGSAFGALMAGVAYVSTGELVGSAGLVGFGLVCAGCAIFAFHGSLALTKGCAWLTRVVCKGICKLFVTRREEA